MAGLRKRESKSSATRVRQHRERMKKLGLKPVTLWLPDVNDPRYIAEIRRQCQLINDNPGEHEHDAWIDAVMAEHDWPPYDWGPAGPPPGAMPADDDPTSR